MKISKSISIYVTTSLAISAALFTSSCGKGVIGGATAGIAFNQATQSAALDLLKVFRLIPNALAAVGTDEPYYFAVKFMAAYLAEDVDPVSQNNVGQVQMIYLNPTCPDSTACTSNDMVTDYFDFSRTAAAVNAEINGQRRIVATDEKIYSYKYVRMDFCIGGGSLNQKFKATATSDEQTTSTNNCGVTSKVMDPPLTIQTGDQVEVNLDYTLVGTMKSCTESASNSSYCKGGKSVDFPVFTPTARKL